jgi:hypothetical protein
MALVGLLAVSFMSAYLAQCQELIALCALGEK